MSQRFAGGCVVIAAVAGASAVAAGAFGSHGLREVLDEASRATWRTAVDYHAWHAFALLATGLLARARSSPALRSAAVAFVLGIVVFSGSLYALALGAPRMIGTMAPLGGLAFVAGWVALAVEGWRMARSNPEPVP
ncbi:MAG: DUF423 domain-containing protein [Lysobacteraceae bacterium]|nr:MAG: DUF423 domain-containing protein [Xanthomonadaceae bacterium]